MCGGRYLVRMLQLLAERPGDVEVVHLHEEGTWFYRTFEITVLKVHPEVLRHGIRTGLNLMQILSGIAIHTYDLVMRVAGTGCQLLDTRKTTPGFRAFEKEAVRLGGGRNHRFNRLDGILLKKEDIAIDGGITKAVRKAAKARAHLTGIEVEAETFEQVDEASSLPEVTHILLDNMAPDQVRHCVSGNNTLKHPKILEASGVKVEDLRAYAETGVPFVSTSALIRGAQPVKMKMRISE